MKAQELLMQMSEETMRDILHNRDDEAVKRAEAAAALADGEPLAEMDEQTAEAAKELLRIAENLFCISRSEKFREARNDLPQRIATAEGAELAAFQELADTMDKIALAAAVLDEAIKRSGITLDRNSDVVEAIADTMAEATYEAECEAAIKALPSDLSGKDRELAERKAVLRIRAKYGLLPQITAKQPNRIAIPLDKVSARLFPLAYSDIGKDGRARIKVDVTSERDKNKGLDSAYTYFSLELAETEILEKLTPPTLFDECVLCVTAALCDQNGGYTTKAAIYRAMGNEGDPGKQNLAEIEDSLIRMMNTRITIDNEEEAKRYRYAHIRLHDSMLPARMVDVMTPGGKPIMDAIQLAWKPPFLEYAEKHKQLTRIPAVLYDDGVNKTPGNLLIRKWLIRRISHMKTEAPQTAAKQEREIKRMAKTEKKLGQEAEQKKIRQRYAPTILYDTLIKECKLDTPMKRQRAIGTDKELQTYLNEAGRRRKSEDLPELPGTVGRYMSHYKKCGWIKGYKLAADNVGGRVIYKLKISV